MILSIFLPAGTISGAHNDSSCSSGPDSPHNLNQQQTDASGLAAAAAAAAAAVAGGGSGESSGGGGSLMAGGSGNGRAQYVSATCVVFTHYSGDAASVVDEHFSRALNFSDKNNKVSERRAYQLHNEYDLHGRLCPSRRQPNK
uniref:Protein vestigial n=1 Tax=Anopheles maculatus TaxID=74869 RepID=A0A182T4A4_9DIPT